MIGKVINNQTPDAPSTVDVEVQPHLSGVFTVYDVVVVVRASDTAVLDNGAQVMLLMPTGRPSDGAYAIPVILPTPGVHHVEVPWDTTTRIITLPDDYMDYRLLVITVTTSPQSRSGVIDINTIKSVDSVVIRLEGPTRFTWDRVSRTLTPFSASDPTSVDSAVMIQL